jgi:hypothetical protein
MVRLLHSIAIFVAAGIATEFAPQQSCEDFKSGTDIPGSWKLIQDITRIISPKSVWPGLPKEE